MERPWYKEWFNSPFYHKLYFERDEKEAESFIQKLIHHLNPPPGSRMLDVACGRGRHSKILAQLGFEVTGIDISPASIAWAKRLESDLLSFYVHDMRLPFRGNYFAYTFNFFTSFGYFRTRREHDDAFRTIAKGLKPGGIFVLDYLNVRYAEQHLVFEEEKRIGDTLYQISRWHDELHFYKKIVINDPSLSKPQEFTEEVAKFSSGDFTEMLSFQAMQVTEVFGDYSFAEFELNKSPRLMIISRKMEAVSTNGAKRIYSDGLNNVK